jgi:hypothetical protein
MIIFLSLGGVTVIGGGIFLYILGTSFNSALEPVKDVSRYQEVIRGFEPNSRLVKHFPDKIPQEATNVRLFFLPGFMQGGTIFQLRMKLPPEKIKSWQSQFRKTAKRKYISGGKDNSPKEETSPDGVNVTFEYNFYTNDSGDSSPFPPSYEILVLADTRGAPEYDWNHPELYGVAIDISASEIVYWAEDW